MPVTRMESFDANGNRIEFVETVTPDPTLLTTSDDGYRVWLDEDSTDARLWVSRPGAGFEDRAYTFVATSTDPTVLSVAIEDAIWSTRKKVPALTPVTRDAVKQAMGTLTPEQLAALKASVTRRGKLA